MSNETLHDVKALSVFILLTGSTALIWELLWQAIRPAGAGLALWVTALLVVSAAVLVWFFGALVLIQRVVEQGDANG